MTSVTTASAVPKTACAVLSATITVPTLAVDLIDPETQLQLFQPAVMVVAPRV